MNKKIRQLNLVKKAKEIIVFKAVNDKKKKFLR